MAELNERASPAPEAADLDATARLLGLRRRPSGPLDAHEMLRRGLPARALTHLLDGLRVLETEASLEKAVGMSLRTWQRRKEAPDRRLTAQQSGRAWTFAGILARATAVFGSQEKAEEWLARPATGLDRQRPIDLLETPAGVALVERFLKQLEHGVYV